MDDGRRHFLFGITVSEIAFILFFILLLFSFFSIAELDKKVSSEKTAREEVEEKLKRIGDAFGNSQDIDPDEALTILARGAAAIAEGERKEQQITSLQKENEQLQEDNEFAGRTVKTAEDKLRATKGQLANLQKRAGVGDPPCWVVDESGDIEYLFHIKLFGDESVQVRREAPRRREADYVALPSVPEITGDRLQMSEFKSLSLPIYQVGEQSQPKCRHFVRVNFADREACRLLLVVERYFYKSVHTDDQFICTD